MACKYLLGDSWQMKVPKAKKLHCNPIVVIQGVGRFPKDRKHQYVDILTDIGILPKISVKYLLRKV
ncbi:hypothetical protein [Acutalibacter sp.]|jgi:hypothetical protein|uniref:hypothetical protein n=1 Tax=Acutalibacter sp. TaxID=1918636 RepID=UPI00216C44EC|nr:hypothetical protein [Acutalibacter sp.]